MCKFVIHLLRKKKKQQEVQSQDLQLAQLKKSNEQIAIHSTPVPFLLPREVSLGNVYAFGPRFEADKSDSKKYLAEIWMIEIEIAFSELEGAVNCAKTFLSLYANGLKLYCIWTKFETINQTSKILENMDIEIEISIPRLEVSTGAVNRC
ncbi:asparaginyl-tRNA synthetase 2 [Artemisia annua]|uniref:Asparaginyl-tRNA synthetase 2 n=1 Tax=Artemisia annua TaxID=35608 RepID=A0A2U1L1B5_ARTAN|nr:asparaginyl-tRNA synthetase 2 [Artemisia annua]